MERSAPVVKAIRSRDNPLWQRLRKLNADPGAYRKLGAVCPLRRSEPLALVGR